MYLIHMHLERINVHVYVVHFKMNNNTTNTLRTASNKTD